MENIIDLIVTDSPASEISDSIKNALYSKAAEKIDAFKPLVSSSLFGDNDANTEYESSEEEA